MGQTLTYGVYLPAEGERNCYSGLANNWQILDDAVGAIAGKAAASHTHGNITNGGAIGSTAGLPVITGTDGVLTTGTFGNTAGTFCEGNDSRLSDARTPVAHTHTKSDVTDLFNSANTWTGANTFQGGGIVIKDTSAVSAGGYGAGVFFRDYQGNRYGYIQPYVTSDNYKNIIIGADGTGRIQLNSFLVPYAANAVNLGTSDLQWNNLYAKNYFYNGVAWGLDKYNSWTEVNDFNNLIGLNGAELWFKNNQIDDFTTNPAEDKAKSVLQLWNKNTTQYSGGLIDYQTIDGSHIFEIACFGYPLNNATPYQHRFRFAAYRDGVVDFYPTYTNSVNLGTIYNKWKTLNGVNPGALSLPSSTYSGSNAIEEIDRTGWVYDGTFNSYSPPVDCWLSISNGGSITVWGVNTAFGMKATGNIALPLRYGETYNIALTNTPDFCRIYPCLGNV